MPETFPSAFALPTIRQLQYLAAVAETRHFGRAARACGASQPSLSAGLKELERVLGARLVERAPRRVLLTPLGEDVLARARGVLAGVAEIRDAARAAREPLSGPIRVGVIPTVAPFVLPRLLAAAREAFPALRPSLVEERTAVLLDRLRAGGLDLALVALPFDLDGLDRAALGDDPLSLTCPPGHPAARAGVALAESIGEGDLLLLERGHCLRGHALDLCGLPAARHASSFQGTSLNTLVQMAAGGIGVTVVPEIALKAGILAGTGLVAVPLGRPQVARALALVWRPSAPRRADFHALADFLRARLRAWRAEEAVPGDRAGQRGRRRRTGGGSC